MTREADSRILVLSDMVVRDCLLFQDNFFLLRKTLSFFLRHLLARGASSGSPQQRHRRYAAARNPNRVQEQRLACFL